MTKIRLRYPLLVIVLLAGAYTLSNITHSLKTPTSTPSSIIPHPKLSAGYYIVLNTKAELPKDLPAKHIGKRTYVGPLLTIRDCHESRIKIKPLYPGVVTDLLKINTIPDEN